MSPTPFHSPVYLKEQTASTMNDARELIREGRAEHGCVCRAGFQSEGRGRISGRTWDAVPGENLLFTLVLDQNKTVLDTLPLSLSVGVLLARVFENLFGVKPQIKWPNDIYLENRKISGILCESRSGYYLVGIGINVNQSLFPRDLASKASSLKLILGKSLDLEALFSSIMESLYTLSLHPLDYLEVENRLYGKGELYTIETGYPKSESSSGKSITGTISGINKDGSLRVQIPAAGGGFREKSIYSGEITVQ